MQAVNESATIAEMASYIKEFVHCVKEHCSSSQKDQQKRIVEQMKSFIHQHYMEDIWAGRNL